MKEKQSNALEEIRKIQERLSKARKLEGRDIDAMFISSIARSEFSASRDELDEIREKSTRIRSWLLTNGDLDVRNAARRSLNDETWVASVDVDQSESNQGFFLFLFKIDDRQKLSTGFILKPDGTYHIRIEFLKSRRRGYSELYEVKDKLLDDMALNEGIIIIDLLNDFISTKGIKE